MLAFRAQFDDKSPLDELVRSGAQQMLQTAIEAEVTEFVLQHSDRVDEQGKRLVVRNGYLPSREILTGAGGLEVRQPRVRDNTSEKEKRVSFSSSILPVYLRRSQSIDDLLPWLYLKGISTSDFREALQSLVGEDAKCISSNVIVRLKEKWGQEYDDWSRRDLTGKEYIYLWADGIHANVRLEDEANKRQCMLVLMGATVDGRKELIAVVDARRKFEELTDYPGDRRKWLTWYQQLYDIEDRGKSLSPESRLELRQTESQVIWSAMRTELDSIDDRTEQVVLPKSDLRKALNYAGNHWVELTRYLSDPLLPMDNNECEQLMRQVSLGRKNWLFCGSVAAGERNAGFMTLVSSAHRNDLEVWSYTNDILRRLLAGETDYEPMLPWNWATAHPERVREFRQEERRDRVDRRQTARAKRQARKKLLARRQAKK